MSEWTPGPWEAVNERDVDTADGKCIAIMGVGVDEFEANAHLIAAAPDLYEALEKILRECGDEMSDGYLANFVHSDKASVARAALAKARGETK